MNKKQLFLPFCCCIILLLIGCASLGVKRIAQDEYANAEKTTIRAEYFSLSDDSLQFVKLYFVDGKIVTLPQAVSASGVRYTNEFQYTWWTKGNAAWLEKLNENGEWIAVGSEFIKIR